MNRRPHINIIRKLTMIIALNSNYEGGEIEFPTQNVKIKMKQGDLIAFPPYWTHEHFVNSPCNDTYRYTINLWCTNKI